MSLFLVYTYYQDKLRKRHCMNINKRFHRFTIVDKRYKIRQLFEVKNDNSTVKFTKKADRLKVFDEKQDQAA